MQLMLLSLVSVCVEYAPFVLRDEQCSLFKAMHHIEFGDFVHLDELSLSNSNLGVRRARRKLTL